VKKIAGSTTTVYVFSGSKVVAEYDNGAAPTSPSREYIYSGTTLIGRDRTLVQSMPPMMTRILESVFCCAGFLFFGWMALDTKGFVKTVTFGTREFSRVEVIAYRILAGLAAIWLR
jgi:hypothetical protein